MYHLNKNTLAYYKNLAATKPQDMSESLMHNVVGALNKYLIELQEPAVSVEEAALEFYLRNHAFAALCAKRDVNEILSSAEREISENYVSALWSLGRRLFTYVLLITTRESRHLNNASTMGTKLADKYGVVGEKYSHYRKSIPLSSDGAVNHLRQEPPSLTLGDYVTCMTYVFTYGSYSSGYGGKAWGNVSRTLLRYIDGTLSLEAFIDTAFTLAHNNGPIFNKGIVYTAYSSDLVKILDVQASGQVPQFISDCAKAVYACNGMTSTVLTACHDLAQVVPEIQGHVEWDNVTPANGATCNYPSMKKTQTDVYGQDAATLLLLAASEAKEAKEAAEAYELAGSKLYITDTEFVYKAPRSKAA